jgi:poly(A) polymerase
LSCQDCRPLESILLNKAPSEIPEPALEALHWACEVATRNPDLLKHPPARPTPKQLKAVPVVEIRKYLDNLLMGRYTQHGLDALLETGVLKAWLPEVEAMVGFGDGEWQHKDLWKHSKQVVWQSLPRLGLRWGALLHDIGKIKTRRLSEDSQIRFFGHSEVGAAMFRKHIAHRLGFEGELYEQINFLILYHLRASQYDSSWTDSAVRRFTRELGDGLNDLLDLGRADITTKRPGRRKRGLEQIDELEARIRQLKIEDAKEPPLPKGLGNYLMELFELPPSRVIGDIKRRLEQEVECGVLEPRQEMPYYLAWVKEHREELGI